MRSYRNLSTLLSLLFLIPSALCLIELPSFPRAPEGLETPHNQFIVQFESTRDGKEIILLGMNDDINVVKQIPSRNIIVLKFTSTESAETWRKNKSKDIKYFKEDTILYINNTTLRDEEKIQMAETTPYGIKYVKAMNVQDDNSSTRKVCIVDSGYDINHPDLPNNPAISGQSFVPGYDWDTDEVSHGTHVAGTIMALGGNGIGVKGVIRNGLLKVHISKVFDASGSAFTSTVIAGFESCVEAGSNVINMSLGGGGFNKVFADAIANAYELGVLTFAAAGNSGDSTLSYPASYPFVTSVASITNTYDRSSFSTFNDDVDLCAPGSGIVSTIPGGLYASYSGTSMACPHVVGVAALVWSHYPQLHHDKLRKILEETATDLPLGKNDGYDVEFGHGLVNALASLEAVSGVPTMSPIPSATAFRNNKKRRLDFEDEQDAF